MQFVIPAKAGIQDQRKAKQYLDSLAELGQAHFPWPAAGRPGTEKIEQETVL